MDEKTFAINFSPESAGSTARPAWLRIEQEDWAGKEANFEQWLGKTAVMPTIYNLGDLKDKFDSACNSDGSVDIGLRVYLSNINLNYRLVATRGTLSEPQVRTDQTIEQVTVEMATSHEVGDAQPGSITCAHWVLGEVYNLLGHKIVPPPRITIDSVKLLWPGLVVGTLRYGYTRQYHRYNLHINPADQSDPAIMALLDQAGSGLVQPCSDNEAADAVSGADALKMRYQSTVIAIADGAVEWLDVETPELGGYCDGKDGSGSNGYGRTDADGNPLSTTTVTHGDGGDDGAACYNRIIVVDPCSKEVVDDYLEPTSCHGDE